jgi:uncharacterized peroxidase-related enzyme
MTWIKTIPYEQAEGSLLKLYDRVKGADDNVDNIMLAHSLRPNSMNGHMSLYKNVLHHPGNTIDKWLLEMFGVYTSMLNKCNYCVDHHYIGMKRLLNDDEYASNILDALKSEIGSDLFEDKIIAALDYVNKLTQSPADINQNDIQMLRNSGWEDGEILEINQVTAYFNYANRTVLGLGIHTDGDVLGLSPSDSSDEQNWQHK